MATVREDLQDQIVAIRETVVDGWKDLKSFIQETWPALTFLFILLVVALWVADPAPPSHVVMATGPEGSSNQMLGKRYQKYFAERGITLELQPTEGSVDNVMRLMDQKNPAMAAFVVAGAAAPHSKGLLTLGSINYQPVWCFYRADKPLPTQERIKVLWGTKMNFGTPMSATHYLTRQIMALNGFDPDQSRFTSLPDDEAVEALKRQEIDTLCLVDTYEAPNVQKLMKVPGVQLAEFTRADAYARLVPAIEMVTMPQGGVNLRENRPDKPYSLIAVTTEILVDERLHPAIQTLFLLAARDINGRESFFSKEGEFPAFMDSTQHRSKEAQIFYEKGTPVLMEVMPFWLAEFIRRLVLTMLPFFAIAYPIIRSMPNYHKNRVRGRINRMYGGLKFFEQELVTSYKADEKDAYLKRLDDMERDALGMKVPKSVSSDYYTLRSSIDFVRNCLMRDGYAVHRQAEQGVSDLAAVDTDESEDE